MSCKFSHCKTFVIKMLDFQIQIHIFCKVYQHDTYSNVAFNKKIKGTVFQIKFNWPVIKSVQFQEFPPNCF